MARRMELRRSQEASKLGGRSLVKKPPPAACRGCDCSRLMILLRLHAIGTILDLDFTCTTTIIFCFDCQTGFGGRGNQWRQGIRSILDSMASILRPTKDGTV